MTKQEEIKEGMDEVIDKLTEVLFALYAEVGSYRCYLKETGLSRCSDKGKLEWHST